MADLLHSLASGDLTASNARGVLDKFHQDGGNPGLAYNAFASWIWQTLNARRSDDDLRDWHGLMLDVAFRAERSGNGKIAERIRALTDVLALAVRASDRPNAQQILQRAHVPAILRVLADNDGAPLQRSALLTQTGLQSANLSRLLSLLISSGLIMRSQSGKEALLSLTEEGRKATRSPPSAPKKAPARKEKGATVQMKVLRGWRKPSEASGKVALPPVTVQVTQFSAAAAKANAPDEVVYSETPNAPKILCSVKGVVGKSPTTQGVNQTQYHYQQPIAEYPLLVQKLEDKWSTLDE